MRINKISTPDELINAAGKGWILEAEMLANITESYYFSEILPYFSDYSGHIKKLRLNSNVQSLISKGTIDLGKLTPELIKIFSCAQIAAACYLFSGCKLKQSEFKRSYIRQFAQSQAKELISKGTPGIRTLIHKIHNVDAIRTIQTLKLLGLFNTESNHCKQLSLGAGHGSRDLHSIHQIPSIKSQFSGSMISKNPGEKCFVFESTDTPSSDIVLIDNDPNYADLYSEYNSDLNNTITAYNTNIDVALSEFQKLLKTNDAEPRNLVALFRIDHNMIPDVESLLSNIYSVIDEECDFILSIGAGYSPEEFVGRLNKVDELYKIFKKLGLRPLRIKFYRGSSIDEQLANPAFGLLNFTTYELLYCKLVKKQLKPMLKKKV